MKLKQWLPQPSDSLFIKHIQKVILIEMILVTVIFAVHLTEREKAVLTSVTATGEDYIKWVDFNVSYEALCAAYEWDVKTHGAEEEVNWIELLAYTATRTGGGFDEKALSIIDDTAQRLSGGETTMEELTEDMKYYSYYKEAYTAVLGGW